MVWYFSNNFLKNHSKQKHNKTRHGRRRNIYVYTKLKKSTWSCEYGLLLESINPVTSIILYGEGKKHIILLNILCNFMKQGGCIFSVA